KPSFYNNNTKKFEYININNFPEIKKLFNAWKLTKLVICRPDEELVKHMLNVTNKEGQIDLDFEVFEKSLEIGLKKEGFQEHLKNEVSEDDTEHYISVKYKEDEKFGNKVKRDDVTDAQNDAVSKIRNTLIKVEDHLKENNKFLEDKFEIGTCIARFLNKVDPENFPSFVPLFVLEDWKEKSFSSDPYVNKTLKSYKKNSFYRPENFLTHIVFSNRDIILKKAIAAPNEFEKILDYYSKFVLDEHTNKEFLILKENYNNIPEFEKQICNVKEKTQYLEYKVKSLKQKVKDLKHESSLSSKERDKANEKKRLLEDGKNNGKHITDYFKRIKTEIPYQGRR
ncbi:MAG: hypothetical protein ACK4OM_07180, partial [Alphaproteobacteria bacterium]